MILRLTVVLIGGCVAAGCAFGSSERPSWVVPSPREAVTVVSISDSSFEFEVQVEEHGRGTRRVAHGVQAEVMAWSPAADRFVVAGKSRGTPTVLAGVIVIVVVDGESEATVPVGLDWLPRAVAPCSGSGPIYLFALDGDDLSLARVRPQTGAVDVIDVSPLADAGVVGVYEAVCLPTGQLLLVAQHASGFGTGGGESPGSSLVVFDVEEGSILRRRSMPAVVGTLSVTPELDHAITVDKEGGAMRWWPLPDFTDAPSDVRMTVHSGSRLGRSGRSLLAVSSNGPGHSELVEVDVVPDAPWLI